MMVRLAAVIIILALVSGITSAHAEKRVALVVGNGAYQHMPGLENPPRDASDMAHTLGALGFEVVRVVEGDHKAMLDGLAAFGRAAARADVAVMFYAGHGIQVGDRNYLLPVSADVETEADLPAQAVKIADILDVMEVSGAAVKLVFLDACRDNPLATSLSRGSGRGLARIDASAAGTLIAFATAPGSIADDGDGRNSPFTAALMRHMATPDLEVRQVLGRVRSDVYEETGKRQVPWVNEALIGDFYFAGGDSGVAPPSQPLALPAPPAAETKPTLSEPDAFAIAQSIGTVEGWDAFLAMFPDGAMASFAMATRNKLTETDTAIVAAPPAGDQRAAPPASAHAGFIFPDSDRRRLGWSEVSSLSGAQLRIARNEIFARRGRYFRSADLQRYFGQFDWYRPFTWDVSLNPVETANVRLLKQIEDSR